MPETAADLVAMPESLPGVGDREPISDDAIEGEIAGGEEILAAEETVDAAPIFEGEILNDGTDVNEAVAEVAWSALHLSIVDEAALAPEGASEIANGESPLSGEAASSDEATEFIETDRVLSLIESLLFVSDRPVSVAAIKQLFKGTSVRTKDVQSALERLAVEYAAPSRGISLEEVQGGYQLRTKIDNADFLRRLAKTRPFRLSGPALETMAIIAYKQPIVKSEIDQIRGVESGHLIRALMERGLVNFAGKSELPGKPMQYGTARKFLEIFGLRNLKELPTLSEIDDLIPEGIGEVEEKPALADITESMSQTIGSTYSEGEDELTAITDQLQAIDSSSEFFEQEKVRQREVRDRDRAQNIRDALTVDEPVDEKDRRWLERYDAKRSQQAAGEADVASGAPADGAAESPSEDLG